MDDFLGISIVGVVLSGLVEFIKSKFKTKPLVTKALVVGLSVVVGGLFVLLSGTPLWTTILGILAAASTVYALFFK